jgi:NAD(P)-dependent dehydrogenase (short-subunit alcohol dehydrogenase family)
MCRVFSEEGARVAFTYRKDAEGAKKTLRSTQIQGEDFGLAFQASVLDTDQTTAAAQSIEDQWGGIDILVNNAGITQNLPIALLDEEDWDKVMDINVKGTFLTTRTVLRGMIRRKSGTILNIGSLAGMRALDAPVHYSTSKAAIAGFSMALSKQVARYAIRVNCLAPGLLEDGVGRNLPDHRLEDYLEHCSLGRTGTLEEVARFAAFIVSDACPYMNGEIITMDGGL